MFRRVIRSPNIEPPPLLVGEDAVVAEVVGVDALPEPADAAPTDADQYEPEPTSVELEAAVESELPPDPEAIIRMAREEANLLIEEDRRLALELIEGERKRAQELIEEQRKLALEEGHLEGLRAAESETAEAIARLASLVDSAETEFTQALQASREEVVKLCLAIGEKLARKTLETDGAALAAVVEEALGRAAEDVTITVRVHPDDEPLLDPNWRLINAARKGKATVIRQSDPTLQRGGCVIEAGGGHVDASLAARLDAVRQAVGVGLTEDSGHGAQS